MNYSEKLKSPQWQKKRLEILQRDNFTCQLCSDTETELQVHHLKYTGEPQDAPNEDLQTLCKHCHESESFVSKSSDTLLFSFKEGNNYFGKLKSGKLLLGSIDCENNMILSSIINQPIAFCTIIESMFKK
jgi:HNH endonuclease